MKYALTFQYGVEGGYEPTWDTTDTIIVEAPKFFYEDDKAVAEVLKEYGLKQEDIDYVISEDKWFVRNIDDVDVYGKIRKE